MLLKRDSKTHTRVRPLPSSPAPSPLPSAISWHIWPAARAHTHTHIDGRRVIRSRQMHLQGGEMREEIREEHTAGYSQTRSARESVKGKRQRRRRRHRHRRRRRRRQNEFEATMQPRGLSQRKCNLLWRISCPTSAPAPAPSLVSQLPSFLHSHLFCSSHFRLLPFPPQLLLLLLLLRPLLPL